MPQAFHYYTELLIASVLCKNTQVIEELPKHYIKAPLPYAGPVIAWEKGASTTSRP